jgi:cobalt/nickel transport system ATP-binding protein
MIMDTCSRVLVLKDGFLVADGNPKDILSNEDQMEAWGLELPLSLATCPNCNTKKK